MKCPQQHSAAATTAAADLSVLQYVETKNKEQSSEWVMHRFQMHWGCLRQAVVIYQRLLGCNFQLFSSCSAGKTAVPGLEPLYSKTVHSWAEKPDRIFATVKSGTGLTWLGFPIYNWTKICNKYRKHWKIYLSCQVADQADLGTTLILKISAILVKYFWVIILACFTKF